ncbi:sulfatase-like hydrolase/transferase [Joostella sp.]|uniref:sulfatase-like hydrolase/transferase n=1 Tax=Joostella sp. TaxID=2231138 RepID=UPI003A9193C3
MNKLFSIITILILLTSCNSKQKNTRDKESETITNIQRPNIILIFADDWGYGDLGIHGSSFCKTPNLDKMAAEGIDFQNFSVVNPVCSPSRVGVITGQYPARQSVHGHFATVASHIKRGMPDWLDPKAPSLPRMLKSAGYKTAHFGKWHLTNTHVKDAPSPLEYGYDEYGAFNLPSNLHQMHVDSTLYKTIDFAKRNKEQPFFINAWIHATHTPHYPKKKYMDKFSHLDEQKQVYAAVVAEYDDRIGELFKTLKEIGVDNNTLVLFSSDNGPEITGNHLKSDDNSTGPGLATYYSVGETNGLRGQKRSLFAGGIRIPFIARWPGTIPAGVIDKTTELTTVDLLPTFLDLASAKFPKGYEPDGVNIVDALKGKGFKRDKAIYWNWLFAPNKPNFWPEAGIQENNWKLLVSYKLGKTELYNITSDWAEQKDVSLEYPEKVEELLKKLKTFESTLPKNPPANTFSKERETL